MKQDSEDGWWEFLELCSRLKTAERFDEFFDLFLTLEEKRDLALRWLIVKQLLEQKKTQREIAEELQVSIAKITRGSNALKIIKKWLREFLLKES